MTAACPRGVRVRAQECVYLGGRMMTHLAPARNVPSNHNPWIWPQIKGSIVNSRRAGKQVNQVCGFADQVNHECTPVITGCWCVNTPSMNLAGCPLCEDAQDVPYVCSSMRRYGDARRGLLWRWKMEIGVNRGRMDGMAPRLWRREMW